MAKDVKKRVDVQAIKSGLAAADEPMIREIIRQAELFLAAQLQSGLAADSRSMTTGAIQAAMISFLVGGTISLHSAHVDLGWHFLTVVVLIAFLGTALGCALRAAKPTSFDYAGSSPRFWLLDVQSGTTLGHALIGQAAQYAEGINNNVEILDECHKWLRRSTWWMAAALLTGVFLEFVLTLSQLGKTGSVF